MTNFLLSATAGAGFATACCYALQGDLLIAHWITIALGTGYLLARLHAARDKP